MGTKNQGIKIEKHWEMGRDAVRHEDSLIYQRLAALLTVQGFVLAAFFLAQRSLLDAELSGPQMWGFQIFLSLIFAVCIALCFTVRTAIQLANKQLGEIDDWWTRLSYSKNERKECPPLRGDFKNVKWLLKFATFPWYLVALNVLCIVGCILLASNYDRDRSQDSVVEFQTEDGILSVKATFKVDDTSDTKAYRYPGKQLVSH